ncbi:hypothetical protein PR003_g15608 [Phytophthora rubi]|uniref:Uncharacterized protein n=1 Tax=Phytophthora rubi TaxID=129364 RepID=A0A6A3KTX6_9STRA|nr:hypothetical protein PR001_g16060 [Phytophthora rubi]KAE9013674.1 hypothetical protein PR002_g14438 [Phytophthora rubi]KAE9329232.1 hypothetical protein PR003_g15608 [Phytophthora rubi]
MKAAATGFFFPAVASSWAIYRSRVRFLRLLWFETKANVVSAATLQLEARLSGDLPLVDMPSIS